MTPKNEDVFFSSFQSVHRVIRETTGESRRNEIKQPKLAEVTVSREDHAGILCEAVSKRSCKTASPLSLPQLHYFTNNITTTYFIKLLTWDKTDWTVNGSL